MVAERSRTETLPCGCRYAHHDGGEGYTLTPCADHRRPACMFCGYVIPDEAQTVRDAEKRTAHFACLVEERKLVEGFR